MSSRGESLQGKRSRATVKLGTTVLVETYENMDLFRKQYPEFKTPGRIVDLMAGLCLRINPGAAATIRDCCIDNERGITLKLREPVVSEFEARDLRAKRDYFHKLADHMSRFAGDGQADDQADQERVAMKRVDLQDGSYLVIPNDWIVANERDASSCDYAFVVEVRYSKIPDLPHVVILSPTERCSYDDSIATAAKISPKIRKALGQKVEPQYDEGGHMLNREAVDSGPFIGVFPILDSTSYEWGDEAPYGAMVYRR